MTFLAENPVCAGKWSECEKAGLTTPATDVDHEFRHKGKDDPRFWNNKFNALCGDCHLLKTNIENRDYR